MREHAFDAHPDEIAVLAVVADPLFELSLVCALDQAAIDMSMIPAVAEPAEAFTKTPGVPGRISEGEPDDLCRFVRQGTFRTSQILSTMALASSKIKMTRRPWLCRPANASVFSSLHGIASARHSRSRSESAEKTAVAVALN